VVGWAVLATLVRAVIVDVLDELPEDRLGATFAIN
jgi:hypothetical protein